MADDAYSQELKECTREMSENPNLGVSAQEAHDACLAISVNETLGRASITHDDSGIKEIKKHPDLLEQFTSCMESKTSIPQTAAETGNSPSPTFDLDTSTPQARRDIAEFECAAEIIGKDPEQRIELSSVPKDNPFFLK